MSKTRLGPVQRKLVAQLAMEILDHDDICEPRMWRAWLRLDRRGFVDIRHQRHTRRMLVPHLTKLGKAVAREHGFIVVGIY